MNGACVATNSDGICEGSNLIADNNKKECDACDSKCTSCKIPNFNGASTVNLAQCTGCLPGFVLSNGKPATPAAPAAQAPAPATVLHAPAPVKSSAAVPALRPIANKAQPSFPVWDTPAPLPTITGINIPTPSSKRALEWWEILLMALGCAFIFLLIVWLWRRRARKQQAKKTLLFATTPGYNRTHKSCWRWWLIRFGEKLSGHRRSQKANVVVMPHESESMKLAKLRTAEEAREEDMIKLIGDYNQYTSRSASPAESSRYRHQMNMRDDRLAPGDRRSAGEASLHSAPSIYSQMTGVPRRTPEPRHPLRKKDLTSRFSTSTLSSDNSEHLRVPPTTSHGTKNPFWK
ncbi:hypothetical protein LshimejAT787_0603940 [Lyophyllum shimeji]|uniref:Uncharacterized protein n=1 Tax=Lyophyllum shimeji TaxID=47721 RepID=A0A9P3PMS8_LYOSH|nr:hypothetical protein LshimejAT787_0603940 [Lyophyllum shimeji]